MQKTITLIAIIFLLACSKKDLTTTTETGTGSMNIATPVTNPNNGLQELNLPAVVFNYSNIALPAYLITPTIIQQINTPVSNAITNWGATLGRVIFYDKSVSVNQTISCASCHKQTNAFSDITTLSKGFAGGNTGRNSMALTDAKYYPNGRFFWDERAATLEAQVLVPIQDHVEMGMNIDTLIARMKATTYYPILFQNAFGNSIINSENISRSLSQFVRSIISYQSKYDSGRVSFPANQDPGTVNFTNFTAQENRGKQIFFSPQLSNCAACHGSETFSALRPENNGLDAIIIDKGVGGITGNNNQVGLFKVTSLRNVALTAPYMHDGRFKTLEEVIEHYSTGVKASSTLSPRIQTQNGVPRNLNLSDQDKAALVAFIKTLTDRTIATNEMYSNPFKN